MKIDSKVCPNCGANLKFNLNNDTTKCLYCNSIIKISNNKNDINNINDKITFS